MFPVNPGKTNFLSGTMGELRSSHFHAGIDIKTFGRTGLPIYAAADGYIARIKVSSYGYGNVLYMQHPNGTTTVYAHLKEFEPKVAEYVRKKQYAKKDFNIELFPSASDLRFEKGDIIGYSGNSGSSSGPHLHFEIRDRNQEVLNPLHYGFDEVSDHIAPIVQEVAFRPMDVNSRVEGAKERKEYWAQRQGSQYTIPGPVRVKGVIGIEIRAHDKLDGAANHNGITRIDLIVDSTLVHSQNIDKFSFATSRDILIHTAYDIRVAGGGTFTRLYTMPGNRLGFYDSGEKGGLLFIDDDQIHPVTINLYDNYGNLRQMHFQIKGDPAENTPRLSGRISGDLPRYTWNEGAMFFYGQSTSGSEASIQLYVNRNRHQLNPAYFVGETAVYIWDPKVGLPDSAIINDHTLALPYLAFIKAGQGFTYYHDDLTVNFPSGALAEDLLLSLKIKEDSEGKIYQISENTVPLRTSYRVTVKPGKLPHPSKIAAYEKNGRSYGYEGGKWQGNKFTFTTRSLGEFVLLADTLAPEITPISLSSSRVTFRIRDNLSGIDNWNAYVDGEWLLMNYDHKRNLLWSERLDENKPLDGTFILEVSDNLGNKNQYNTNL